ncbi:MAG TPA: DUF5916 domain-containing protein [Chryseolinea sp.]|nr:DUF5916 domain-containing protein [Chryseolinea sp.]
MNFINSSGSRSIMRFVIIVFCILVTNGNLCAQNDSIKFYTTQRLTGHSPKIDGASHDAAWAQVPWGGGDFRQRSPDAGAAPSVQTKFKILYDDKNLYILFKNFDPEPGKIVSRMSRRDGFEGDLVEVNIDSYNDKRTAFSFSASVSGVKGDEYISNNGGNWDVNWDPIWYLQTRIDDDGWTAEMRIPLSQLRFADKPEHTWGLQIARQLFRKQEQSTWQYIPPDATGWVHLFGELRGLSGIRSQKQVEIQPYVVAKTETFKKEEGNPFVTGKSSAADVGLDAKIGITSDITLDLTVNPDFGQVEADPSQVNLSAFRVFFQERRPFFIEGNSTLNFPVTGFNSNNLFYSRRIGRNPQYGVETDQNDIDDGVTEYVKPNPYTTILGAAKLTGKNKKGFSWGILESVTSPERAKIDSLGIRKSAMIEPMTNYVVGRMQQDINKGNTVVGGMFTSTNRNLSDANLQWLHKEAYTGGVDVVHNWNNRKYFVSAKTVFSNVRGSEEAITLTQEAPERYFQRPDNLHADVDTTRKSLTGTAGTVVYGKRGGKFVYEAGYTWLSPELELNDIGFLSQTDLMTQWTWLQYRILNPVGIFRSLRVNGGQSLGWDFDRRNTSKSYDANSSMQFKNFWSLSTGASYSSHYVSNANLRGGPALRYPGSYSYWLWISTDQRKKLNISVGPRASRGLEDYSESKGVDVSVNYKPMNALSISLAPSFSHNKNKMQYVNTGTVADENRYIVGEIDQTTARLSLRMTYMITPNLSVQAWGQPFGTSGEYSNFKYITDANASDFNKRFTEIPEGWVSLNDQDEEYAIDENSDGIPDYKFAKPDFNVGQFRSNMVVRWEYIPGSTFFLVWSQDMNGEFYNQSGGLHDRYTLNFPDKPHNVFMLKYTYRFIL